MKKELTFIIVWELVTYFLLLVSNRALNYLYLLKDNTFETKYIFLIFGVVIFVYMMLGILLGMLIGKIKYFSMIGYVFIGLYALYFAISLPAFYAGSKVVSAIYPNWLLYQRHNFTTALGSILLGLMIVNTIRYKIKWLKQDHKAMSKIKKNKWQLLLVMILTIGIVGNNYKTPQEKVVVECLSLLYTVPEQKALDAKERTEAIEVLTDGFQGICTEQALNRFVGNGLHKMFREAAYEGRYTIELKDIELNKRFDFKTNQLNGKVLYAYKVELLITYTQSDVKETIFEEGSINLRQVDREWKVDFIRYKALNKLFKS